MEKKRLLIVEDESIVALALQRQLEELGYDIQAKVRFGEDAVKQVNEAQPDLILMDIQLAGELDGIETAALIRKQYDIPVIYVTAFADDTTLRRAQITGPFGYVIKPIDNQDLHVAVMMALYKHQVDQELRQSEERLRRTLDSMLEGCQIIGFDWCIVYANDAAAQHSQREREAMIGTTIMDVYPGMENTELFAALQRCMKERTPYRAESELSGANGSTGWFVFSAEPIDEGIFLLSMDITERKRAEEEREEVIRELNAFAHTVSHDVRNPVGNLYSFAQMLLDDYSEYSEEEVRRSLERMSQSALKANSIVDELLLLSTIREVNEVPQDIVDIPAVISAVKERLADVITQHKATISMPDTWPTLVSYAPWLEEVWMNYISNGIKYGGHPPHLELGGEAQPDGSVRFWVADNGEGISVEDQARVFTIYTRLSEQRVTGYGLGLSIVDRIITRLGGEVYVKSEIGKGSLFGFTLPAAPAASRS